MAQRLQASPAGPAPDAANFAASAAATWQSVDTALSPIIGPRGVAALYKRSLFLTRTAHPCLAAVYDGEPTPGRYAGLEAVLAVLDPQTTEVATAAQGALLKTFQDLLVNLVGPALTDQLLRPALDLRHGDIHPAGDAVQDASP